MPSLCNPLVVILEQDASPFLLLNLSLYVSYVVLTENVCRITDPQDNVDHVLVLLMPAATLPLKFYFSNSN